MFRIMRVTVPKGQSVILFGGSKEGNVIADPGAVLEGDFILAFPALGYIRIIDKGSVEHGKRALQLSNASELWYYTGEGRAACEVHADGRYTWMDESGAHSVKGKL
ncbi:hypothetical protein AX16_004477 [Volvariella volvacea WC 439]|nr:hypothetical protein AX16_004477 [Volvariella volvacea WC 439]